MWKKFDLCCDGCGYVLDEEKQSRLSLPVQEREFGGHCPSCSGDLLNARYRLDGHDFGHWETEVRQRCASLWRYQELLPITHSDNAVTLGEGWTPLIALPQLGEAMGLEKLYLKDERQGPTATFKDRQATVAISFLKEQGINEIVLASTGNVAIAYSAYAARAGMRVYVFFPDGVAKAKIQEASLYGAQVMSVGGTYDEAKAAAAQFASEQGIFLDRALKHLRGWKV
ncbi:MAG: hypothetical protein BRC33_13285 [Cyanobacteria bacterium SW_9_44_58]|nr:MAG: hypothetical protein BRC33_13285 [Cyanobacteria bacterium SW_9_44_58]